MEDSGVSVSVTVFPPAMGSSPPVPHLVDFVSVPCPKVLRSSPVLCQKVIKSSKPIFSWSSPAALGNDLNREGIYFGCRSYKYSSLNK